MLFREMESNLFAVRCLLGDVERQTLRRQQAFRCAMQLVAGVNTLQSAPVVNVTRNFLADHQARGPNNR